MRVADRFARKIVEFLKLLCAARSRRLTHKPLGGCDAVHALVRVMTKTPTAHGYDWDTVGWPLPTHRERLLRQRVAIIVAICSFTAFGMLRLSNQFHRRI